MHHRVTTTNIQRTRCSREVHHPMTMTRIFARPEAARSGTVCIDTNVWCRIQFKTWKQRNLSLRTKKEVTTIGLACSLFTHYLRIVVVPTLRKTSITLYHLEHEKLFTFTLLPSMCAILKTQVLPTMPWEVIDPEPTHLESSKRSPFLFRSCDSA